MVLSEKYIRIEDMLIYIFILSVTILLYFFVLYIYRTSKLFRFARKLNGPTFYPLIGSGYVFIGKNILKATSELVRDYTDPISVWIAHNYVYATLDPHEIKVILNHENTLEKAMFYDFLETAVGNSIMRAPVKIWKHTRRTLNRSFYVKTIEGFVPVFSAKSEILSNKLKENDFKNTFEIFARFTCDTFYETLIGVDLDYQNKSETPVYDLIYRATDYMAKRMVTPWYYFDFIFFNSSDGKGLKKVMKELGNFVLESIKERRTLYRKKELMGEVDNKKEKILIDLMFEDKQFYGDKEIIDEICEFTTAASETSGFTLAFVCTLLGMHQNIQDKVYEEIITIVGTGTVEYHHLGELKYLERVLLEAMRLFPAIPILGRFSTADIDLGTRVLPKNSNIIVSLFHLHRKEKYWPDPLKFDPDRHLPEEAAKRIPYSYLPFSGGSRNCIGWKYGLIIMKTTMVNIVRKVRIYSDYKCVSEMSCISTVSLKTDHDLNCRFLPRT